jgi:hypothetical protein
MVEALVIVVVVAACWELVRAALLVQRRANGNGRVWPFDDLEMV